MAYLSPGLVAPYELVHADRSRAVEAVLVVEQNPACPR